MRDEQAKLTARERLGTLWYSFRLAHRLIPAFFGTMLASTLLGAAQPMVVLFFSARVITELAGGRDIGTLALYAGLTVGLSYLMTTGRAVVDHYRNTLAGWSQVMERVRMLTAERFAAMDFAYTEDTKISETLARMDVFMRGNGLGMVNMFQNFEAAAQQIFTLGFSLVLLSGVQTAGGGWGSAATVLLFVAMAGGTFLFQRGQNKKLAEIYSANARANTAASYYARYIKADAAAKDVRLYAQTPALIKLFSESFNGDEWLPFFRFAGHLNGYDTAIPALMGGLYYLLVGSAALDGAVPVGSIVQSVGAVTALAGAAGALLFLIGSIHQNLPYVQTLRDYMQLPDLLEKGTHPVPAQAADYEIEFKNVSFRYPGAAEYALKNLNLTLTPHTRLAVVGRNGSGKTTMIKLLCRLYDPTEGEILVGGVNIRDYDPDRYAALFSVVFQDHVLFPLELGGNVAVGEWDAARAGDCLDRAGFTPRLETLPHGLSTLLYKSFDEDGVQVSGGEAQKIALARALYKDAPVVILDEPTAALDPQAEYEVYTTFNRTIGDKTAVFISHRLSSCRFANKIAVFDGGQMVQYGSHDALLADKDGTYSALWNAQAQYYVDQNADTQEEDTPVPGG